MHTFAYKSGYVHETLESGHHCHVVQWRCKGRNGYVKSVHAAKIMITKTENRV